MKTRSPKLSLLLALSLSAAAAGAALHSPNDAAPVSPVAAAIADRAAPPWLTSAGQAVLGASMSGVNATPASHIVAAATGHDPHAGLGIPPAYPSGQGSRVATAPDPHGGTIAPAKRLSDEHPVACERSTASNGYTVEELYGQRERLNQKTVRVAATVTQVTTGLRDGVYLHVRDGSGAVGSGNHDLTVITQHGLQIGQVVELEGQLTLDQDLGWGYRYKLLLRNAQVVSRS